MDDETNDLDLDESMSDTAAQEMPRERAERFYDRLRTRINRYVENRGSAIGKAAEFLLLVPDMFILLWRLLNDSRVSAKNKVLLGSGVAYFVFPFDLLPEAFLGPIGYLDDLVLAVYILNRVLVDTDAAILRDHWSGSGDVLTTIQKVLNAADSLVGSDLLKRIKRMARSRQSGESRRQKL
jgi:uncharacterized membrane protein YkvA (DUF1232 family)